MKLYKLLLCLLVSPVVLFAKYDLSVCAIFKNEAPYLREWIEFHKIQGVKHFYLYNNQSTDEYKQVLSPYISSKEVTLVEWDFGYDYGETESWARIQRGAYNHCLKDFGNSTQWLAFIDTDEFLFCIRGTKLTEFLKGYEKYGGLVANWRLFGTSDVETIPPGRLMIEMLNRCSEKLHYRNNRVKSIVQPQHVITNVDAHNFMYKKGYPSVNEHFREHDPQYIPITHDKIQINHYWTRTEKHFRDHKLASRNKRHSDESLENLKKQAAWYNIKHDTTIHQFIPELRRKMKIIPIARRQ